MALSLVRLITHADPQVRNQSLEAFCRDASLATLMAEGDELEAFRRQSESLYERVRALFFLYGIHRFHLPLKPGMRARDLVPFGGYQHLLQRRFEEAIQVFLRLQRENGPSDALSSALAAAYHRLGFQTLADQVRHSVRSVRGNQWMFRMGHPADHPLRLRRELLARASPAAPFPILRERTPVRMDLTHCGWSDIFFLGMDYPEGAKVLNVSIDLGVHGRDPAPLPPVEAYLRVIDEPVLRLTSVDLGTTADIADLAEVYDFARDYLGLLKAALIAAGVVPPGLEGSGQSLKDLLCCLLADSGLGLELVSHVHNIPKGSRLAVSTNLLACMISVLMRATGQASSLTGSLTEEERRLVAARAILGEWLGGSGGGWQDSGGLWPGIKLIQGVLAGPEDVESGISRGRLLPNHTILGQERVSAAARDRLQASLVLVHGGMAQNVGPILEMVTEKYLLRAEREWRGRQEALGLLEEVLAALGMGDIRRIGAATTRNFFGPIQTIIPWASNHFTETLIERVRRAYGQRFWGFWMLGGMSGGGMGFMFDPEARDEARGQLLEFMRATKRELEHALPFAMEPVVYDFAINEHGSRADWLCADEALLPSGYYSLVVPSLLRREAHSLTRQRRAELDRFATACRTRPEAQGMVQGLFDRLLPRLDMDGTRLETLDSLLQRHGFDRAQHTTIQSDLRSGRIGLAQNRLPPNTEILDVRDEDVWDLSDPAKALEGAARQRLIEAGREALACGSVAVLTLAAGAGSRWTQGAGVVKALNPFCRLAGRHRTFLEVHLAKSQRTSRTHGAALPHLISTGYLTHQPIAEFLAAQDNYGYAGPLHLSPGRAVGLRLVPLERDLRFAWEEMPQQLLDEQAQKVRESLRAALIGWARHSGEGSDYTDNVPTQCLHPVGHWFEVPNLLRNGLLRELLTERPQLRYLMLHNVDTLGASVDPLLLGAHLTRGACLSFEVITRRVEDRGGGLARVDGRVRLVEGLALPREEIEFDLSYYNTMTTWIDLERLLKVFQLGRGDLSDDARVADAVRALAARMPTYITLKDVKKRWGHGQEDVFPVTQFEKLWSDLSALPEVDCQFLVVSRARGQQLKDPAQLDGWLRDGSAAWVESLGDWSCSPPSVGACSSRAV
jgi:hypothetical protein